MKLLILKLLVLLCLCSSISAQSAFWGTCRHHYYSNDYKLALDCYQSNLVYIDTSDYLYPDIYFKMTLCRQMLNDTSNVDSIYNEILTTGSSSSVDLFGDKGNCEDEKHRICLEISSCYIEQKKYVKALHYLDLSSNVYRKCRSDCGNESHPEILKFATCYFGLGQWEKALQKVFSEVFRDGLYDVEEEVNLTIQILESRYTHADIMDEFSNALNNMEYVSSEGRFVISVFGVSLKVPNLYNMYDYLQGEYNNSKPLTKKTEIQRFTETYFYKKLAKQE